MFRREYIVARETQTKPCEWCNAAVTRSPQQQRGRMYWTCGRSCANKIRIHNGHTVGWGDNPHRGKQDTRPCVVCAGSITRYLKTENIDKQWTCSHQCSARYRIRTQQEKGTWHQPIKPKRGDTVPCEQCGKPVYRCKGEQKKNKRFCSPQCASSAQAKNQISRSCEVCGVEMRLRPSEAKRRFCSKACNAVVMTKRPMARLHNGKPARKDRQGYVVVWEPEHPNKAFHGWQYEHRLIVEKSIERYLGSDEHVHHINGIKDDNRIENLEIMDGKEHAILSGREYRDGVTAKLEELELLRAEVEEYRRRFGPLQRD